jgi:hypothetical protein
MTLSVTPKAAKQIQKALTQRGGGIGLRVAVKTSGCSGYAYALEFADAANPEDQVFETEGVKVLVDAQSLPWWTAPSWTGCAKASTRASSSTTPMPRPTAAAASPSRSDHFRENPPWRCCKLPNPVARRRRTSTGWRWASTWAPPIRWWPRCAAPCRWC